MTENPTLSKSGQIGAFRVALRIKAARNPVIGLYRAHRAELRKWAKGNSGLPQGLADIQCQQLRVIEHDPADELAQGAFLATWVRLVRAVGLYRQY